MATGTLEERVAALEAQMAQSLLRRKGEERPKDWRRSIGMFTCDEIMWQIDQNALAHCEEDRRRSPAKIDAEQGKAE